MTVNVSKPSVNVREKLAELDKPTGIAGEAMLRAETPQEQFNLIGAGRRNFIQNGAMGVSQRGTSFALTANLYTLDRWRSTVDGTFADLDLTVSQSTDAPDGFQRSLKVEVVTAEGTVSTEGYSIEQRIEAQSLYMLDYGTSNAKPLTLSFWVKSAVAGKYGINLRAHDGGDGYHTSYTINAADTWEYKTVIINGNTLSGGAIANDNGIGLWIRWYLINGTTSTTVDTWTTGSSASPTGCVDWNTAGNDWFITGVQLELGKVATPFEHRSYGEELALCQRYFCKLDFPQTTPIGPVHKQTTATIRALINLPVPMRATPSINSTGQPTFFLYWSIGGSDGSATNTTGSAFSVVGSSLDNHRVTLSAGVSGVESLIGSFFGYGGDLNFDAEL